MTNRLQRPAILSLSLLNILMNAAIVPVLSQISDAFPQASRLQIQMALSLPALISILFNFSTGYLARRMPKKTLLALGLIIYAAGGAGTGLANSIGSFLVLRAVLGAGTGIVSPLASDIIADFYEGQDRAKMIGFASAAANIAGMIFPLLSAQLAGSYWRYAFLTYLIGFAVLLFAMAFIPREPSILQPARKPGSKLQFNRVILTQSVLMFLILMIFYAIPTNLSLYIEVNGIGSPSTAALAFSLSTFISTLVNFVFARLYGMFSGWLLPVGLTSLGLGFLAVGLSPTLAALIIAEIFLGIALGILFPYFPNKVIEISQPHETTARLAALSASFGLGMFVSPFFFLGASMIMSIATIQAQFALAAGLLGAGSVLSFVFLKRLSKEKLLAD